jgi:BirA family transcriptional regulator, biotin operon repressor / biotin---[acetyl-CoA-carboxylase] ligase
VNRARGAGTIAAALRQLPRAAGQPPALPWRLQWHPITTSTETLLDQALARGLPSPLAVIARRQNRGHGQQGKAWLSPAGGVWLSAALPWSQPAGAVPSASPALAVTLGLALQLEALGLEPCIKWPNDLLLAGRKVAGVLPRLRWRGSQLLGCRVGVGLNGRNRVPAGAIALAELQVPAAPEVLAARVLRALEWAVAASGQAELVRRQAERRLWHQGPLWHAGEAWEVAGLDADGSLRLRRGERLVNWRRDF